MVRGYFDNGGTRAYVAGSVDELDGVEEIDLICPLPDANEEAIAHCERRRDRIAILSLPAGVDTAELAPSGFAAVHYPWVRAGGELTPPGGHVAGAYASGATEIRGLDDPPTERSIPDVEAAALVARRVNPVRGTRLWSAVTLDPDPEWKYVNVRRLLIYLERSIDKGTKWAVFEPNGEPLWAAVRAAVGDFLTKEWRAGTLKGARPEEAFFVRCDRTTMTQDDLDNGRLVCLIGVAPLKPAEFVIVRIGQWTADRCA
ncbi:MAG: uncharacterized protein QOH76_2947 [Thermoleophilaceae bacterium]|nr:uncharacterized protein [Thermoleophilaceae bacterium]